MTTIAVTGSYGFIGMHLIKQLQNLSNKLIPVDIKDGSDLKDEKIIEQVPHFDILIHLAARSFVPESYITPHVFFRDNYILTLNALELCRKHKASMILFSSYVYGKPIYLPIDEQHPTDGFNPYAQSKLICEELCKSYNRHFKVPLIILRPFNIYGPGQDDRYLIAKIIKMAKSGRIELENPLPKRDFIHVYDVVNFILFVLKRIRKFNCEVFNLGSGTSHSVNEIVTMAVGNKNIQVLYNNVSRPSEIYDTVCNNKKAIQELDWHPIISLQEGIDQILKE
jgi:nucleoside-diphosphate-sugar epimerase